MGGVQDVEIDKNMEGDGCEEEGEGDGCEEGEGDEDEAGDWCYDNEGMQDRAGGCEEVGRHG